MFLLSCNARHCQLQVFTISACVVCMWCHNIMIIIFNQYFLRPSTSTSTVILFKIFWILSTNIIFFFNTYQTLHLLSFCPITPKRKKFIPGRKNIKKKKPVDKKVAHSDLILQSSISPNINWILQSLGKKKNFLFLQSNK